jgi:hypothetical protein
MRSVKLVPAKDLEPNIPMEDADRNTYTELPVAFIYLISLN